MKQLRGNFLMATWLQYYYILNVQLLFNLQSFKTFLKLQVKN
jgi:hypothetical protein